MKQTHLPGRSCYEHNPNVTCVGILPEEARDIAVEMAKKLNNAKGPCTICVPCADGERAIRAHPARTWDGPARQQAPHGFPTGTARVVSAQQNVPGGAERNP